MVNSTPGRAQDRQRLIRLVHIARRDLRLDADTYRAALRAVTGGKKDSCSAMSAVELQRALDHFKRVGFKVRIKSKDQAEPSRPLEQHAMSTKIRAIWLMLHELGAIKDPSEAALAAYVKRITKVEALQWIDGEQFERVIETLKMWALRHLPGAVKAMAEEIVTLQVDSDERTRISAALHRAFDRMTFDPMHTAYECLLDVIAKHRGNGKPAEGVEP